MNPDIEEIKNLLSKISAWPWKQARHAAFNIENNKQRSVCSTGGYQSNVENTHDENLSNTEFIAKAPEIISSLINEVEKHQWVSVEESARFWVKAEYSDYCWEWRGSKNNNGYGVFRIRGKIQQAHRVSFSIINRVDINKLDCIAHKCDNPSCVNPDHLFETDHQGNMTDKHVKGRACKTGKTSKYRGVSWRNDSKRWRSYLRVEGKNKSLGNYGNEIDAAKAYDKALYKAFGDKLEREALNFPDQYLPPPPIEDKE